MGIGSLLNHYQNNELEYNSRMFLISFSAQIQLRAMMAYLCGLTVSMDIPSLNFDNAVFLIMIKGAVPIFVRLINSMYLLRVSKSKKISIICILEVLAWLIVIKAFYVVDDKNGYNREKVLTVAAACLIQIISFSLTESVILGFMKDLP